MLMTLQLSSKTVYPDRVIVSVNDKGDTTLTFSISDARYILGTMMAAEVSDSIILEYIKRDSLNTGIITLLQSEIRVLTDKNTIKDSIIANDMIAIDLLNVKINNFEEINESLRLSNKKNKRGKIGGFTLFGGVIVPFAILSAFKFFTK